MYIMCIYYICICILYTHAQSLSNFQSISYITRCIKKMYPIRFGTAIRYNILLIYTTVTEKDAKRFRQNYIILWNYDYHHNCAIALNAVSWKKRRPDLSKDNCLLFQNIENERLNLFKFIQDYNIHYEGGM